MIRELRSIAAALLVSVSLTPGQTPVAFSTIDVRASTSPRPLVGGGQTHLVYELQITNLSPRQTLLEAVEVRAGWRDTPSLLRLEGPALDAALRRVGAPPDDREKRVLPAGRTAVLHLWVSLPPGPVPTSLTHRFTIRNANSAPTSPSSTASASSGEAVAISGVEVAVAAIAPRVIGAPLQGDHWLAANGPDNEADHRRALLPISGQSHIAQRFAIDWVRLFDDGRTAHGDVAKNSSYRCYGANVVAVADGTIVDTHDGIPENVPDPVARAVPITPETIGGNYIVLDVGDHNYAFFAHLQPHSLKVRRGDRVRRGQLLALVGNTGNSSEPHLHFHVADRNAGMAAEGIPYALQAFDLEALPEFIAPALATVGNSVGISPDGIAKWLAGPVQRRRREIPMRNAIVRFPDR